MNYGMRICWPIHALYFIRIGTCNSDPPVSMPSPLDWATVAPKEWSAHNYSKYSSSELKQEDVCKLMDVRMICLTACVCRAAPTAIVLNTKAAVSPRSAAAARRTRILAVSCCVRALSESTFNDVATFRDELLHWVHCYHNWWNHWPRLQKEEAAPFLSWIPFAPWYRRVETDISHISININGQTMWVRRPFNPADRETDRQTDRNGALLILSAGVTALYGSPWWWEKVENNCELLRADGSDSSSPLYLISSVFCLPSFCLILYCLRFLFIRDADLRLEETPNLALPKVKKSTQYQHL